MITPGRKDLRKQQDERLEKLLLEGIESGPAKPMTPQDWAEIRSEALKQYEARKSS